MERVAKLRQQQAPADAAAAALQHVRNAERAALKIPGLENTKPLPVKKAGVIGGGTMGGGIAMCFMNVGVPVTVLESSEQRKQFAMDTIKKNYLVSVRRKRMTQVAFEKRMSLLTVVVDDYSAFKDADYVIEAVFESMALKKTIFTQLDAVCKPTCVLATNTSTLSIDDIAAVTKRPESVIGAHFFSPANIMKLLEFVRGKATNAQTIATSLAVGKLIKKVPVIVGNCFGFVSNRMMLAGSFSVSCMLEEGAFPREIDAVVRNFGYPIGFFEMHDLAGVDVLARIRTETPKELVPARDVATIEQTLYKQGRHGQKTGKGYYLYHKNAPRTAVHDPWTDDLIVSTSAAKKIKRRSFGAAEILVRYIYIMINEAAKILEEGFAIRPSDVDVVFIYGFSFPAKRGGPCYYADTVGLRNVVATMRAYNKALGDATFPPPAKLLVQLAGSGKTFASMN